MAAAKRTQGFENLDVYRLSERMADAVWVLVKGWQVLSKDTVGKQLIRAADSVGANVAEGTGRGTYKDNCRFVDIARGSLYETRHWLRRADQRELLTAAQIDAIGPLLDELGPRLNAYRNSLHARARTPRTTPK